MSTYELTINKIRQLPESLVEEVDDFIDFLLLKREKAAEELTGRDEAERLAESDFADYGANLSAYEDLLARGEIQW